MHYTLRCVRCGKAHDESTDPFILDCGEAHPPSLLRADYSEKEFIVDEGSRGIFRYRGWLPVRRSFPADGRPAVFRSERLSAALGLPKLVVAFSGYWPERGAYLETCSFKELEALSVCARVPPGFTKTMVVASAGNTGRAFLQVGSAHGVPLLVVVPESALSDMWITGERRSCVRLAVLKNGDYFDAIELAAEISRMDGYYPEGGAKNVARRDGMGVVLLAAAEATGEIPAHYFQAVGSGTGGIAAWETAERLGAGGRFGANGMRLHLVQNEPFAVMTHAWLTGGRELPAIDEGNAKKNISLLHSRVLSNRKPPYAIAGGVFDALTDTRGRMYGVSNAEAETAGRLFESIEGIDLDPAAEVALAGLIRAARAGNVPPADTVLFNATGGGSGRLAAEGRAHRVEPDFTFVGQDTDKPADIEKILSGRRPRRAS